MRTRSCPVIIVVLLMASAGFTADPRAENASRLYESGSYAAARDIYTEMAQEGGESGALYYNIGNCYLKEGGGIGKALFYFEMAKRLIPRDTALLINLRYARSLTRQVETAPAESLPSRLLRGAFDRFSLKEAFGLWISFLFLLSVLLVMAIFMGRNRALFVAAAVLVTSVLILMLIPLRSKMEDEEKGGVIVSAVNARLEPFMDAGVKYEAYEGALVKVLKSTKEWHKIKNRDGKVGWIPKESLWPIRSQAVSRKPR